MDNRIINKLPVQISEEERRQYGLDLSNNVSAILSIKDDLKTVTMSYKQNIQSHEAEVKRLSGIISSGVENREVVCHERPDLERGIAEIVRSDTGGVISARPLRSSEYQKELPLESESEAAGAVIHTGPIVISEILMDLMGAKQWNADSCTGVPFDLDEEAFNGRVCVTSASTADAKTVMVVAYRLVDTQPEADPNLGHYHSAEVAIREPHKAKKKMYLAGPEIIFTSAGNDDSFGGDEPEATAEDDGGD